MNEVPKALSFFHSDILTTLFFKSIIFFTSDESFPIIIISNKIDFTKIFIALTKLNIQNPYFCI